MTTTDRAARIADQMRADCADTKDLDAYTLGRVESALDADWSADAAERQAHIRDLMAARTLVLAEIRGQQ